MPESKSKPRKYIGKVIVLSQLFSAFSDSRTTFEILSRFADHQGRDEKIHFHWLKFPKTLFTHFDKNFNFSYAIFNSMTFSFSQLIFFYSHQSNLKN